MTNKVAFLSLFFLITIQVMTYAQKKDKRTAFDKVVFRDNHPYVEREGEWVKLVSLAGEPIETYLKMAVEYDPTDWQAAFVRYTHYMMDDLEIERDSMVDVEYEHDGKVVKNAFPLRAENRDLASDYYEAQIGKNRIIRDHTTLIPDALKYLHTRIDGKTPIEKKWLTKEQVVEDLEHLEWQIVNNYSYAELTGFDYQTALDVIITGVGEGISKADLALQLKMLMANFGDGHSRVSIRYVIDKKEKAVSLPFRIIENEGRFYAVNPEKKDFYHPKFNEIIAINGVPIGDLYTATERLTAKSTPKYITQNTVDYLRRIYLVMGLVGQQVGEKVQVTFRKGKRKTKVEEITIALNRLPNIQERHRLKGEVLTNNIGYIAMNNGMERDDAFIDSLHLMMQQVKNTNGLIIDIRDNGGGNRKPLLTLLPYLIQQPVIANVAHYRIDEDKDLQPQLGYLDGRYAYYENSGEYSETELAAISKFKKTFTPVKQVDPKKYTDYHYMVVSPSTENNTYYYDKPVIVLINEGCFSASDIFAAGIRQGDNVKLLGNTTGGGSGYTKSRLLPNSQIKVKLSRMFSFQPNGAMYDGHGVKPDIEVTNTLQDKLGQSDSQLQKAIDLLSK